MFLSRAVSIFYDVWRHAAAPFILAAAARVPLRQPRAFAVRKALEIIMTERGLLTTKFKHSTRAGVQLQQQQQTEDNSSDDE
jgi:hypothetical protein